MASTRNEALMPTPENSTSGRRAASGSPEPRGRQKRKKYTPAACEECRKRKIKCNGAHPCERCLHQPQRCSYADRSDNAESRGSAPSVIRKMEEKIALLQEQVALLVNNAALVVTISPGFPEQHEPLASPAFTATGLSTAQPQGTESSTEADSRQTNRSLCVGPTSSAFSFGVAKSSLLKMGILSATENAEDGFESAVTTPVRTPRTPEATHPSDYVLSRISRMEAFRLIDLYEEECGTIYPFIDIKAISTCAYHFYGQTKFVALGMSSLNARQAAKDGASKESLGILRMVLATALVIEGHGISALATSLVDEVELADRRVSYKDPAQIPGLQILTLRSIYQFHCDDEVLAWRIIGGAVRGALEIGLHRRETLFTKFPNQEDRLWVTKLFWCIYVLDRRWSFGAGMPFALHDLDIDPDLPEPANSHPYLASMIAYGHIGSKVWKAMSGFASTNPQIKKDKVEYLDFQVQQWQQSIPPELQLPTGLDDVFEGHSRRTNRLRVLLHLRANQLKILIHKRTLLSPATIADDPVSARLVVEAAKESIRVLEKLNRLTDIYSSQQTCFNYFLVSALGIIFLAVCHDTNQFNQSCQEEFFMALDLIKGLSAGSYVSRTLWRTVRHLKTIGPKLGIHSGPELQTCNRDDMRNSGSGSLMSDPVNLNDYSSDDTIISYREDLNPSGALHLAFSRFTPPDAGSSLTYDYAMDGNQLSYELTKLFEAIEPIGVRMPSEPEPNHQGLSFWDFATEEDLSRALIDLC